MDQNDENVKVPKYLPSYESQMFNIHKFFIYKNLSYIPFFFKFQHFTSSSIRIDTTL
jgi:hypothetical protein